LIITTKVEKQCTRSLIAARKCRNVLHDFGSGSTIEDGLL